MRNERWDGSFEELSDNPINRIGARAYKPANSAEPNFFQRIIRYKPKAILDISDESIISHKMIQIDAQLYRLQENQEGIRVFGDIIEFPDKALREKFIKHLVSKNHGNHPLPEEFSKLEVK